MKIHTLLAYTFLLFIWLKTDFAMAQNIFGHIEEKSGFGQLTENNGVAVADYDGDFDLDIFVVAKGLDADGEGNFISKLFRNNNNGTFTDVTTASGLKAQLFEHEFNARDFINFNGLEGYKFGAYWGDYDNDSYPDIFFTHLTKVQLFHNNGDGTFTEVTQDAGITKINNCENTGATWFDYNNDGFLDLYVANWKTYPSNILYLNNGDGTFTDVTQASGLQTSKAFASYMAIPFDFNGDGFMDLYVSNDVKQQNTLFINHNGASFSEQAVTYNIDNRADDMGITISDYDQDGLFDIFITAIDENFLFNNNGNGTYTEKAKEKLIDKAGWAWGTRFSDFDLDGDEDLIIANGFRSFGRTAENNLYYENDFTDNNTTFFLNNSIGIGEQPTVSMEMLDFDYDHDGDLDLFVSNADGPSFFYENSIITGNDTKGLKWLQVSLQGTLSNRNAVGTILTLTTNNRTYKRYNSGVGFLNQSIKPVHFGLKDATDILELKVEWPSGLVDIFTGLELNSFIRVTEGSGYEKMDILPAEKTQGCTDPNACNYNPNAISDNGTCSYLSTDHTEIQGASHTGYFSNQTYHISSSEDITIQWKVQGGEIIDGNGSNSITVKWGINESGLITAVINDGACNSTEIELTVQLGIDHLAPDKSIARVWNEALLEAIRGDFARPTVHARNLFHTSIAMYDTWAIYHPEAKPYLIGNTINGFSNPLSFFQPQDSISESIDKAISFAAYRLLSHRFRDSPSAEESQKRFDRIMEQLGYDISFTDEDYKSGNAAALGNYIAKTIIDYGHLDGSREQTGYDNAYYEPVNGPLVPLLAGNSNLTNPNRWQALSLNTFIDQSGNLIDGGSIDFLSPEWGNVWTFAMTEGNKSVFERNNDTYTVYHNPSSPPYLSNTNQSSDEAYKLGFSLVSIWGGHLDPKDGVMWDISPSSIGNIAITDLPTSYTDYPSFYKILEGGDIGKGYSTNPKTQKPYEPQWVPRGDYTRVLAEFWADGPDSETPPGHWFTLLNYVSDHPLTEKKLEGKGEALDHLEWDVKTYFALGGAMHDAAISAWSIKGWYDYIRPISAIRYMAGLGQSTDPSLPNYHEQGIPLWDGHIEVIQEGDPLAGIAKQHLGKIKLYTWKGHRFINNTEVDQAGVGWILAENWWPYQRPSFVTPPFAGYVSGHSTFSRAAAEVMTLLTGDEYFPGGMGEFIAKKNEFLVFEEGPSVDVKLQWATYRDASDQCSLSRIWGGIHPPADDIPGRLIGEKIGIDAYNFAKTYFSGKTNSVITGTEERHTSTEDIIIFPNPVAANNYVTISSLYPTEKFSLIDMQGKVIPITQNYHVNNQSTTIQIPDIPSGIYILSDSYGNKWKIMVE